MCWQTKLICISYKSKNFFMPLLHWMNWSSIVPIQSSFLAKLWSKCDEIWVLILNEITTTTTTPPPSRQRDDRFDSRVHQQLTACYLPDIRLPAEITHGYIRTHTHTHTEFLWQSPPALFLYIYIYIYIYTHTYHFKERVHQRLTARYPLNSGLPAKITQGNISTPFLKESTSACTCVHVCVCVRAHTHTRTHNCVISFVSACARDASLN